MQRAGVAVAPAVSDLGKHNYRLEPKRRVAGCEQSQASEGLNGVLLPPQRTLSLHLTGHPKFFGIVVHRKGYF